MILKEEKFLLFLFFSSKKFFYKVYVIVMNINQSTYNYQNNSFKASALKVSKANLEFLLRQGKSYQEIAKIYDKSVAWVAKIIERYNIKGITVINKENIADVIDNLMKKGATILEMQEAAGLSADRVKLFIYANRVRKVGQNKSLEKAKEKISEFAACSNSQILEFKENISVEELAKKYNLSPITIRNYLSKLKDNI